MNRRRKNANGRQTQKPSRPTRSRTPDAMQVESPSAEATTVGWMLAALAAVTAQAVGVILQLIIRSQPNLAWLSASARTILFVAFVAGLATLVLTPITLKVRKVPPPRPILIAAVVAGLMPILTLFLRA